jgi:CRISPR system Cascade subunit CasA
MTYDLRFAPWIPWRRRSGRRAWGPVRDLVADLDGDPVVALAAPRPDFQGAVTEFLIGFLTIALQPEDESAWRALWDEPPSPARLEQAFGALPDAFQLDGDGVRFLQDFSAEDFAKVKPWPIERLLFDAPGEQSVELNKDLFVKRGTVSVLGAPAAAMGLITMQAHAPSGGAGYRTSMRGGGPLTTLVDPRGDPAAEPLWRLLWANVETVEQLRSRGPRRLPKGWARVLPWMDATFTSEKGTGKPTTPEDGHPLQVYFGLPRRLRLELGPAGRCDLTGEPSPLTVTGVRARNYGVEYDGWVHPLSPYYRQRTQGEWLCVHPQPDGLGWRDWAALTFEAPDGSTRPALTVAHFLGVRGPAIGVPSPRLVAFGVDFDNMKCRGWVEGQLPLYVLDRAEVREVLRDLSSALTKAAEAVASLTRFQVKRALFARVEDAKGSFDEVAAMVWSATEAPFYAALRKTVEQGGDPAGALAVRRDFLSVLQNAALNAFDRACPLDSANPVALRRGVRARHGLRTALFGYGKEGGKLFDLLALSRPEAGRGSAKPKPRRQSA